MSHDLSLLSRRHFLAGTAAGGLTLAAGRHAIAADRGKALIAITLDLEMSRHYPRWEDTHWDYEKGNLNEPTKRYAVEAARRVKKHGGVLHFFAVGRVLEQENIEWLKGLSAAGHPIGNHTYDHVNVLATDPEHVQYRFRRSPWLMQGKPPAEVIRENIRITTVALKRRAGIEAAGFRTPGGFHKALRDRPDVQKMLQASGFDWVSSGYPAHANTKPGEPPTQQIFDSIVQAQQAAQPFVYPTGLIEIPMSPISDVGAFRSGRWKLSAYLRAVSLAVDWAIEHRAVFDFLGHPSCLYVTDPKFQAIELICKKVKQAGDRASIVDLGTIAQRAKQAKP